MSHKRTIFLTLMLTLAMCTGLLTSCSTPGDADNLTITAIHWDREVDFCIVGYGLAGAAAAVEAYDLAPDSNILILEKMPEALRGGNSRASGQTFIVPQKDDLERFKTYMRACNEPNPIPEDYLDWWSYEMAYQLDWIDDIATDAGYEVGYVGGGPLRWGSMVVEFAEFPGAGFLGCSAHLRETGSGGFEVGGVYNAFAAAVELRDIEVLYETPAVDLVQDAASGAILGVTARDRGGSLIHIKANKGVLLACGGFENNLDMQRNFHGMDRVYTSGTPGNTGDGIRMLTKAGAQLWHMKNQTQSGGFWLGIKVPEYEATFIRNMTFTTGSYIELDAQNQRFYNESQDYHRQHMKWLEYGHYADLPHERALPVHLIFDETVRLGDTIVSPWLSWPISCQGYVWSRDNGAELDKGWIIAADTLEELAEKIGRDPAEVRAAVDRYNHMADMGLDADFGRDPATMQRIETAPYYAVSLTPTLVATTGGAKRNTRSQVLDWDDKPIANLYCAGELGSYVSNLYQNGVFLSEAILTGRAAAQDAFGVAASDYSKYEGRAPVGGEPAAGVASDLWSGLPDGTYHAVAESTSASYTVAVTVAQGRIAEVVITEGRDAMFMKEDQLAAFLQDICDRQSLDVDVVAGATMDCQAITAALRQAFEAAG